MEDFLQGDATLMGRYQLRFEVIGSRSAHNSLQDELDKAKWDWLVKEIKRLMEQSDYQSLDLTWSESSL
jgi:hypothetical protein